MDGAGQGPRAALDWTRSTLDQERLISDKGMGRFFVCPTLREAAVAKTERINLRLLPQERRELHRIARAARTRPSTWCRAAVLGALIESGGRLIVTADSPLQEYADAKRSNGNG